MRHWVKLHTEILRNPTMIRLTWAEMGVWARLLALAGEIEDYDADGELTGRLDTLDNVACRLYSSAEELNPTVEYFIQLGLLHCDADGVLYMPDFAASQARDTPAMRMQRYRQRKAVTSASHERDADVTPPLRERDADVTPSPHARNTAVTPPHARNTAVTPPPYERNKAVTPPLRDVAESEQNQNKIRTEQQQQQNRTSTHNAVAADQSVDMRAAPMSAAAMSADEDVAWTESDAAWDVERIQAYEELVALGVDTAMAAQLVQRHSLERVWALCEQLRQERAQGNAANTIIPRIARDRPPSHNLP